MSVKITNSHSSLHSKYFKYIYGILLTLVIYIFADVLSKFIGIEILGFKKTPISSVMISILIGIIISNFFTIKEIFKPGISFCFKFILRLGIVFLGIRLSFSDILLYGSLSIPLVIICIISAFLIIKFLINFIKISSKMAYLIGIGTAICGITAIVAVAPIINAKKEEISYATAIIALFGTSAIFLYPPFAYFFLNNYQSVGMFLGTAIHDTSQVIGAGLVYNQLYSDTKVLEIATITKLVRNTFLIFLIPVIAFVCNYQTKNKKNFYSLTKLFPFFVIGFIAMVGFRTLGDSIYGMSQDWRNLIILIQNLSTVFIGMAMAALGLTIQWSNLKNLGIKPMIAGIVVAITVGVVSILTLKILENFY